MGNLPEPFYERDGIQIFHSDCREILPLLEAESVDLVLTDPPYGFRKAGWDAAFPTFWLDDSARIARHVLAIMPGINNVIRLPSMVGKFEYRWMCSIHLSNGMTRGLMGFGNWIAVVVYAIPDVSLYQPQQDATSIPVSGDMPDHPSPKPLRAMTWLLNRFNVSSVCDPFMGSGTTLAAAKQLGMTGLGIEIEERYCEIAVQRLQQAVLPLEMPS